VCRTDARNVTAGSNDGVVEEAKVAVAVIAVVIGRVDAPLGGDGVGAAWCVMVGEAVDAVALLAERGGREGPGQAREIDPVCHAYPHLNDDGYVRGNLDGWLRD
jgi:hypothetical protein